jgi:ATP citrate (pro-S)-lyase
MFSVYYFFLLYDFRVIAEFIESLYKFYVNLYFTYLEINPLVVTDTAIYVLDLAAKLDTTADFICRPDWGEIDYPPPFGRDAYPEEAYIADLDAKSGASLKLTILNPDGRIWTMVAGGGRYTRTCVICSFMT